jgi:uncharacterized membrane protein
MTYPLHLAWTVTIICAAAGLVVALYMTFGYYRLEPFFSLLGGILPGSCRLDESDCVTVLDHPAAHLLGLPNALYGSIYYALIILSIATKSSILLWGCRWASVLTLIMSAFLVYVLMVRMKKPCLLCFAGHIINAFLAVLLWNLPDFDVPVLG